MNRVTLAVEDGEGGVLRKITKIVAYKDGGFAVLMPYHSAKHGFLAKHPVDYTHREGLAWRADMTEYSASDRVKLSLHPDGFTQFSSENPGRILSGRDPNTGEPKGLGLYSQPFNRPVRSGPTFAVTFWGLPDFEPLKATDRNVLKFSQDSLYFRRCTPDTWGGVYLIEGFLFPLAYWQAVRKRNGNYVLTIQHPEFELIGAVLEMQVVPIPDQPVLLGLMASRLGEGGFSAPSGFALSGPTEFRVADALLAVYPPLWQDGFGESLDYPPPDRRGPNDGEQQESGIADQ